MNFYWFLVDFIYGYFSIIQKNALSNQNLKKDFEKSWFYEWLCPIGESRANCGTDWREKHNYTEINKRRREKCWKRHITVSRNDRGEKRLGDFCGAIVRLKA